MKKIFTLLFCTAIISSAFAQDDHRDWSYENNGYRDHYGYLEHRDFDHDRGRLNTNYFTYQNYRYNLNQKEEVIARISSNFDYQIQAVMDDCSLRPWEKRHDIRDLQAQKAAEINNIYSQCGNDAGYPVQYRRY
jgi:hypothetical protein